MLLPPGTRCDCSPLMVPAQLNSPPSVSRDVIAPSTNTRSMGAVPPKPGQRYGESLSPLAWNDAPTAPPSATLGVWPAALEAIPLQHSRASSKSLVTRMVTRTMQPTRRHRKSGVLWHESPAHKLDLTRPSIGRP